MTKLQQKSNDVLLWRKAMLSQSDDMFFDSIHLYCGTIKTPFNKKDLLEDLSAFLRDPTNKETIIQLLSNDDIMLLTAIFFIKDCTKRKLELFFTGTQFEARHLYTMLHNLQERLLFYHRKEVGKNIYAINPLLQEVLEPYLSLNNIIYTETPCMNYSKKGHPFSVLDIVAFLSYIFCNPYSFKQSGVLKKKAGLALTSMYLLGESEILLNTICPLWTKALWTLEIFDRNVCEKVQANVPRLMQFFCEDTLSFIMYIVAASCASCASIKEASVIVQILLAILPLITHKTLSYCMLLRLALLQSFCFVTDDIHSKIEQSYTEGVEHIFAMLQEALKALIDFGFLEIVGKNETGDALYTTSATFDNLPQTNTACLSIDAGFSMTITPTSPSAALAVLTLCITPKQCSTVLQTEVNKQSAMQGFFLQQTPENITSAITTLSSSSIPETIRIMLEEWYIAYSSITVYHGYVLRTSGALSYIASHPLIIKHTVAKLVDGTVILDCKSQAEVTELLSLCNVVQSQIIDAQKAKIEDKTNAINIYLLPEINKEIACTLYCKDKAKDLVNHEKQKEIYCDFSKELEKYNYDKNAMLEFTFRLNNKLIVAKSQLALSFSHPRKYYASAMDFQGKLELIQQAYSDKKPIIMQYISKNKVVAVTGIVQSYKHNGADVTVLLNKEDAKDIALSLSQAASVQLII